MPRRDELYLADVIEACRDITRFVAGLSLDDWLKNDMVRYAVLQRLTVVGEAARRLSSDTQRHYAEVPWRLIGDFRNLAVHNYFSVEWPLVCSRDHASHTFDLAELLVEMSTCLLWVGEVTLHGQPQLVPGEASTRGGLRVN